MSQGRIIILSGPSGSGKTTLHQKLLESKTFKGKLVKSISVTTRPRRAGERHGRDYLFVSQAMFLYKRRAAHFLESEKVFQHYYGTPGKNVRELLRKGKHVLLCIDVKGAKSVWRKCPDALKIFVKTPSLAVLKLRLNKRATETERDLEFRLRVAQQELKEAKHYDFVVVNDRLEASYRKLEEFLSKQVLSS